MTDEAQTTPKTKPRKTWLAAVLALVCPGLGHLYCGKAALGIALLVGPWLLGLGILGIAVGADAGVFSAVIVFTALVGIVFVGQIVWAALIAKRSANEYRLKRYNHVVVYILYFVLGTFLSGSELIKATVIEAFKIPAGSMLPALEVGDQVFVTKIGDRNRTPHRGDLIVFRTPVPPGEEYVKRLIGMPGDEVAISGGVLQLNGQPINQRPLGTKQFQDRKGAGQWVNVDMAALEESIDTSKFVVLKDPVASGSFQDFGPIKVPDGHFFVLGDNRDNSMDSRMWGPVPMENYIGRVHSVWFSWGPDGLRFDRIGRQF